MRIEAVVADLDGTLVTEDFKVSPATIESLRVLRAAAVPFVIATGRAPQGLRELAAVTQYAQIMVCCSGSIGCTSERPLWQHHLTQGAVDQVLGTALRHGAGVAGFDGTAWLQTEDYVRMRPKDGYKSSRALVSLETLGRTRCVTMSVLHDKVDALAVIARQLDGIVGVGLSRVAGMHILDVTDLAVNKGAGVLRALGLIGVDPAAALSFGDMPSDLAMFAVTGRSYAVGSGHPAIVEAADEVLAPVDGDGFASKIHALAAAQWRIA